VTASISSLAKMNTTKGQFNTVLDRAKGATAIRTAKYMQSFKSSFPAVERIISMFILIFPCGLVKLLVSIDGLMEHDRVWVHLHQVLIVLS
jgi:hypothetical protein